MTERLAAPAAPAAGAPTTGPLTETIAGGPTDATRAASHAGDTGAANPASTTAHAAGAAHGADGSRARPTLEAARIQVGYGAAPVLDGVSFRPEPGAITTLIGPNGSGKSTLLKACTRLLPVSAGAVLLDGRDIAKLPSREVATRLAVLPQAPVSPPHLTVRDLVEQGRFPHVGMLRMLRVQDHESIERAIELVGLTHLAYRDVDSLSGGERQRAWIALALAQDTPLVALDEPTTFLDIGHQFEVLELISELNHQHGLTVVMVLHDLNHAAAFSDRLAVVNEGAIIRSGPPLEVLTPDLLRDVFGVEASITNDPATGRVIVMPHRSAKRAGHALDHGR